MGTQSSSEPAAEEPRARVPWGRLSQALALLALEGAACVLFFWQLQSFDGFPAWLEHNTLPPRIRDRLVVAVIVGAVSPLVVAGAVVAKSRGRAVGTLIAVADALSFSIPISLLPALFCPEIWFRLRLEFVIVLGAYGLVLERLLRRSLAAAEPLIAWSVPRVPEFLARALRQPRLPLLIVGVAGASYAVYTGYLSVLNHHRLGTGAFDLAIEDNIVYNFWHGDFYRSSVMFGSRPGNAMADHARLTMALFTPLYALYPRAEFLLWLQATLLGLAAIPLYLFGKEFVSRWLALFVALAYLFYAPLHTAQFYDFHWLPPAVFFYFWFFWAVAARRTWLVVVLVPVLLGMREDVAPGVIVLGLFLLFSGARPALGASLAVFCTVWFVVLKFVVMPWAGTWWFADLYHDLIPTGEHGYGPVVKTLLTNPVYSLSTLLKAPKLEYALHILAPLVFFPFRVAPLGFLAIPGVFFTLLSSSPPCYSLGYQYVVQWVPFLFGGLVLALRKLPNEPGVRHRAAAVMAITVVLLCHSASFGVILRPSSLASAAKKFTSFRLTAEEQATYASLRGLIAMIPPNATVTATDIEAPHLSNRRDLYAVAQDDSAGQYLLISTRSFHLAHTRQNLKKVFAHHAYGLVSKGAPCFYLFKQGVVSPDTQAAIRELRL